MSIRIVTSLAVALCALSLAAHGENGAGSDSVEYKANEQSAPRPLPPKGPTTVEEMEAFVDGFMASQMKSGPVAGATVVVVKDGQVFFQKGYGYEDVEKLVPVDPAQTLFRPGSISKLFTWTSVMQLVEQGKLDLDTDVNTYLTDFKVTERFGKPVTLRNLMTHTAGFEDGAVGYLFAKDPKDLLPLGEWLKKHQPLRARPPTTNFADGTNASYSNWGTALAGHIVELVSGQSFDDYVAQHIFQPLGMERSTFGEPLPESLAPRMSGGYTFEAGGFKRQGFEFIHAAGPAGSLSATAADMARFMLAHLQDGALGDAHILKPETAQLMHTRTMSPDPALNGHALGFYETRINGHRIIGHGGDTGFFHSVLSLLPESNLGLFASVNTGGQGARTSVDLEHAFFDHYFPADLPVVKPPADADKRNARYAGSYRALRHSYSKFEKVFSAFGDENVTAMPDGTLLMADVYGNPARWVEVGDGVFRTEHKDMFVAFKGDDGGRATGKVGPFPSIASARIGWWEAGPLHGFIVGIAVLLIITSLVSAIRQRRADGALAGHLRWARPTLALSGAFLLLFLIAIAVILAGGFVNLIYKIPPSLYVALTFPLLAIPFALLAAWFVVGVWRARVWTFGARLHYSLAAVAVLAFLIVLNYWNLLGYRFGSETPYLLFLGDVTEVPYAKTAFGLRDWAPEKCVGEYALPAATVTTGLRPMRPAEAYALGARSLVIGVANRGGTLNDEWMPALIDALESGLDIVSGMHARLSETRELDAAARRLGRRLIDVRRPPAGIPIASGRKRSGKRLLTVGTDCALGKKYTALVLAREFAKRGFDADFRATGQTGILIAGAGIPLDAVVADFVAGAAEQLSPDADADHWDVVEGQGSLFHPSYSGVSLGLLHGTQPDVIVLCHEEGRTSILGLEDYPLPSLDEAVSVHLELARRTNPRVRCAGVSLNTSKLAASDARAVLAERKAQLGLPVADPMRSGPELEELVTSCLSLPRSPT